MARKGKQHKSESQKQQFLAYNAENRQEKNKIRALARHVKANDNDELAASNLKRIKPSGQTWKRNSNKNTSFEPKYSQLEAKLLRMNTTGAIMTNDEGRSIPKPIPVGRRDKFISSMTLAFNKAGITYGRIYRAM